jgi:peptide/nickel transport system ATP-binding protein
VPGTVAEEAGGAARRAAEARAGDATTGSDASPGGTGGAAGAPVLTVRDLSVEYVTAHRALRAVDSVDLDLRGGEFLGIVGESGSGKSTLLFAVAQLLTPPAEVTRGEVRFLGRDMVRLAKGELRHLRWRNFSLVMQSAMNALNPVMTLAAQMRDACRAHSVMSPQQIEERSAEMLRLVGIDPVHLRSYPHQLSGGMRQRAMIAMALLFTPELVIMDEPTSSLDVVAQRSLMIEVKRLQQRLGFAVIFVTHDMSLVGGVAEQLAVMYGGKLVELGPTRDIFARPLHPYTRGLLEAFPSIQAERRRLTGIPGSPPDLARPSAGCRFASRCPVAIDPCTCTDPPPEVVAGRVVRCIRVHEGAVRAS